MLYSQRSDLDKITDLALNKVRRFVIFLQFKNSSISIRLFVDEYWQCNIAKKAVGHHGRNWNLRTEAVWMYPSWFLRRSKWMYETMVDWSRMGVPLGLSDMWMNYKFSSLFPEFTWVFLNRWNCVNCFFLFCLNFQNIRQNQCWQ